tara:strand:- start:1080 stop:1409 length:330 start_codon:yes stop_codon:yes gene_type:complete
MKTEIINQLTKKGIEELKKLGDGNQTGYEISHESIILSYDKPSTYTEQQIIELTNERIKRILQKDKTNELGLYICRDNEEISFESTKDGNYIAEYTEEIEDIKLHFLYD